MNVTIIGTGNMAMGIGTRVVAGGHNLTIRGQEETKATKLAEALGTEVTGAALSETIDGDVVIFALPYPAISEVMEKYKAQLEGKILVDISNPIDFSTFELIPPAGTSGAEEIAKNLPAGAKLVKAFNTTFAGTLTTSKATDLELDVYVASNDATAAETVVQLANDGGLRGIFVGPLKRAQALEGFQLIHMSLQEKLGSNWMSAIKILS